METCWTQQSFKVQGHSGAGLCPSPAVVGPGLDITIVAKRKPRQIGVIKRSSTTPIDGNAATCSWGTTLDTACLGIHAFFKPLQTARMIGNWNIASPSLHGVKIPRKQDGYDGETNNMTA
ncbi:hypothetical protein ACO22_07268 [Paracoccidioides brasiliensis]|uniref:Uncharacterized protein n=1 Tax=Paracoccidioides brasiliensis TaxID=121759 RepID=A0A1D2J573_PARBR|nr:hypothetical protein ACO22_07268 [Paracoccidioides brasiliensis]